MRKSIQAVALTAVTVGSLFAVAPATASGEEEPASVTFLTQISGGHTVTVDSVTLPAGGFVTIHDGTLADGAVFDSVRGTSAYLAPGTHEDVEVTVDSDLDGETTVFAMAHVDSDGDEPYSSVGSEGANDGPYVANGAPVLDTAPSTHPRRRPRRRWKPPMRWTRPN